MGCIKTIVYLSLFLNTTSKILHIVSHIWLGQDTNVTECIKSNEWTNGVCMAFINLTCCFYGVGFEHEADNGFIRQMMSLKLEDNWCHWN